MSDSEPSARPRQLTMAGAFVIGGSVLLLVAAFDALTNLHSVDTRDEVAKLLSSGTGEGLGITVSQALSGMRVGLAIAAVCAAVSAVLGIYALQRHRGARVALSVLAVPILLTSPLTGGIPGALVVLATLALWSGPARDWFAGRPVRQAPAAPEPAPDATRTAPPPAPPPTTPPSVDVSTEQSSNVPPATLGYGQQPAHQQAPAPVATQWGPPPGQPFAPRPATAVPTQVKVACLLTWSFSGVVALLYAGVMVALVVAKDTLVDYVVDSPAWQRAELQTDLILPVLWLGCLMFFAWSVGALVLAFFTWRRHNWARYLLAASAGATIIAALFAFPIGLPHQIAAMVTIAGLFGAPARAWFARPTYPYGPPPGPPPGQYQPPQDRSGQPPVW